MTFTPHNDRGGHGDRKQLHTFIYYRTSSFQTLPAPPKPVPTADVSRGEDDRGYTLR